MTAPTLNRAQYRLESDVIEAVSLWLEHGTHRAYERVVGAVRQLMNFFPHDSEMFFEDAGTRANPEVMQLLKDVRFITVDFQSL